ncbi:peptidoglycan DD-metalloendopeptidase family protein [Xanthobacter sp. TB0139]|uniref:peptidoglycan DD-metalloendopeptidase family protein n=1 Tax=Xanthobacter sp. TB0139 TaxID=3459178 RepID=UPI0040399E1A
MLGLVSGAIAGCSSDVSRFGADGVQTGAYSAPEVTGSLGAGRSAQGYGAPAYGAQQYGAQGYGGQAASYASAAVAQQGYGTNYAATHVVQQGETLTSIAQRYGVQTSALATANNMMGGYGLRAGQSLIIPQVAAAVTPLQSAAQSVNQGVGNVQSQVRTATATASTAATSAATTAMGAPASTLGAQAAAMAPAVAPVPSSRPAMAAATSTAVTAAATTAGAATITRTAVPAPAQTAAKVAEAVNTVEDEPRKAGVSGPQFRAPVRGRVIASFGPKPGGTRNEGVNFAVPEGTSVRSAEDGTVAYAGNELKGYGNLVLVKHADGYVTAYAHNSELTVKRGDKVRRGQIIAKAGQSGNVQSPQLHFEIRKGSKAVDPSQYVAGL